MQECQQGTASGWPDGDVPEMVPLSGNTICLNCGFSDHNQNLWPPIPAFQQIFQWDVTFVISQEVFSVAAKKTQGSFRSSLNQLRELCHLSGFCSSQQVVTLGSAWASNSSSLWTPKLILCDKVWLGSSHHLSSPTFGITLTPSKLELIVTLRLPFGLLQAVLWNDERETASKPPWLTAAAAVRRSSVFANFKDSSSHSCIEIFDLLFAVYVAEPLRWETASFVC